MIKAMLCILMGLPTPGEKALHASNYELRWAKAITNATPCVQREDGSVYVCPECDGCVVIYTVAVGEKSPRPGGKLEPAPGKPCGRFDSFAGRMGRQGRGREKLDN